MCGQVLVPAPWGGVCAMSEAAFTAIAFAGISVGFCLLYLIGRERFWWAIIPGLAALTLLGAMAADMYIGTNPSNDWASVLVLSAGAAVTALVLKRPDAKRVLGTIATFSLVIGILMMPLTAATKIVTLAVLGMTAVAIAASRSAKRRTTLRPH